MKSSLWGLYLNGGGGFFFRTYFLSDRIISGIRLRKKLALVNREQLYLDFRDTVLLNRQFYSPKRQVTAAKRENER